MRTINKLMFMVIALSLVAYPMTVVCAQEEAAVEAPAAIMIAGTVSSISVEEQTVVVEHEVDGAAATVTLKLTEATQILKGGENVVSSELKQGDKVSVEYQAEGDDNVITTLTIEG